jgi:predicted negative regulator of RcsB-dependent stress response
MLKYICAVVLFLNGFYYAQDGLKKLITSGLNYSYNFDLQKAEEIFNEAIDEYPEYPHGYHYISQLKLWSYLGGKDESELESFLTHSELAKIKGERLFEKNKNDASLSYLLGAIYTLRATANSFNGSSLDAFWAANSAVDYYETTIEIDPEFYDAYLGLGLFNYALSYVPGIFKWAINLSGLSYDKEKGLQFLQIAEKKGKLDQTEAAFHLSKIYTDYVAEYDSASILLKKLISRYPKNSLFHYQYAVLKIKARELNKAEESLLKVIELNHPKFHQTNSLSYFLMGDINFKRNDFTKAVEYYKTFLATTKDIDYTGIANYRIAVSLSMLGDSLESRNRLLLARMGNLDIPDDIYASEKSLRFFETGFSDDFKKVVIAKNNVEAGENEDAFNQLIEIADSIESAEIKGMAYFYLSEAAYGLNKFETSVLYSKKAGEIRYEKEKWVLPYAAYVTAKSNFKMGNYALSRAFLEIAESNNDFQYRDSIEALVNNLTRKLDIL